MQECWIATLQLKVETFGCQGRTKKEGGPGPGIGRKDKEGEMKFFLDTANLNEIREGAALGLVDGVTTNPSLVAREGGVDFKRHVAAICQIVEGDVSAEVTSLDTEGMLREGREYAAIAPNVVVKLHVVEAARVGADVATMPFKVMAQLINHPLTDKGLRQFLADWRKAA